MIDGGWWMVDGGLAEGSLGRVDADGDIGVPKLDGIQKSAMDFPRPKGEKLGTLQDKAPDRLALAQPPEQPPQREPLH